jgi:hypothetical protein
MVFSGWKSIASLAVAGALAVPAAAPAQQRGSVQVTDSQWLIEEGDTGCSMSRRLNGRPGATLVVQTAPDGSHYSVALAARRWPTIVESAERLTLNLGPANASWEEAGGVSPGVGRNGDSLWFNSLPADFMQALGRASRMTISADGRTVATLAIPPAAAAARALAVCNRAVRGQ